MNFYYKLFAFLLITTTASIYSMHKFTIGRIHSSSQAMRWFKSKDALRLATFHPAGHGLSTVQLFLKYSEMLDSHWDEAETRRGVTIFAATEKQQDNTLLGFIAVRPWIGNESFVPAGERTVELTDVGGSSLGIEALLKTLIKHVSGKHASSIIHIAPRSLKTAVGVGIEKNPSQLRFTGKKIDYFSADNVPMQASVIDLNSMLISEGMFKVRIDN